MAKFTAIIIEPRKHKAISFVLQNFLENLNDDWCFLFFHGTENKEYVKNIINNDLKSYEYKIKLINLNVENLFSKEYSNLLKNKLFYKNIKTEIFLIFQVDTLIIKENKHLINDFLEYDYVGAPWKDEVVGNGGLSLRKKSKMLEIIDTSEPNDQNEDEFFCRQKVIPLLCPSFEKAKQFSVETVFYRSPFGVHNFYNHLSIERYNYLINKYPDLKILKSLNMIERDPIVNKFTIVYKIYIIDFNELGKSLLSLIKYLNKENIFEIILYCHDVLRGEVFNLFEKLQVKYYFKYKIIALHYNYYGYIKQIAALSECYNDCTTDYIIYLDNDFILKKELDLEKYIRKDGKIEWIYVKKENDTNNKVFHVWKKAIEYSTRSPQNNYYDNDFLIVTKKSLNEASIRFKKLHNCNYDDYCKNRSNTEEIRIEYDLDSIFHKIARVFNFIEYNR